MRAVLLSNDLMVVSRVQGAATQAGSKVRAVSNQSQVVGACNEEQADTLIVDLATASLELETLVSEVKALGAAHLTQIIAFGPHVHEERLAAARAAGCDAVMSRGQFFSQVDTIFR